MIYPGKVLLFGEYTILSGSKALALPLPMFYGKWVKDNVSKVSELQEIFDSPIAQKMLDLKKLKDDLINGYNFSSSIPQGQGLGSSGALVACLYEHFAQIKKTKILDIREDLANLENVYHRQSSGIDPLVSLLKKPIKLNSYKDYEMTTIPDFAKNKFFLIDSLRSRKTHQLVENYQEVLATYKNELEGLTFLVNQAVDAFFDKPESLKSIMFRLSQLQLKIFSSFIPDEIKSLWQEGLDNHRHYLKLCGAGGGGFFLGYKVTDEEDYYQRFPRIHF